MSYLQLNNLVKEYGGKVRAVEEMQLNIEQGEFVVFLGPSGCGKTTTMRMIAGLEDITAGDIILDGNRINDLLPKDRNISMVFQGYSVWPHMTVKQNITYPLKLKKVPKKEWDSIIDMVSEITDIGQYLDRYPSQLSGGQRQRVAVARAIAVKPKVFLMDEPLSNLDAKLRVSMRTKLKEIHQTVGATTIFVTHDQAEAMSLADKVVVMNMGVIEQIGSPLEIYDDCESKFVANFIGTPPTNFFDVKIVEEGGTLVCVNEHFKTGVPESIEKTLRDKYLGKEVSIGIRPENINITGTGNIDATVQVVEPQGSYTILSVLTSNMQYKIMASGKVGQCTFAVGEKMKVKFDTSKAMFFDKDTEKRIR